MLKKEVVWIRIFRVIILLFFKLEIFFYFGGFELDKFLEFW